MKIKNAIIRNSARIEEITGYLIMKDYLFQSKRVVIGDRVVNGEPDIISTDYEIGLEVTTCEIVDNYVAHSDRQGRVEKSTIITPEKAILKSKDRFNLIKNTNFVSVYSNLPRSEVRKLQAEEYYTTFAKTLEGKYNTLNFSKNYSAPKYINLIFLSDFAKKDYISIDEIFNLFSEIEGKFKKKFENAFICINDRVYDMRKREEVFAVTKGGLRDRVYDKDLEYETENCDMQF